MIEKKDGVSQQENLTSPVRGKQKTALVCGSGGFIGSHMVKRLKAEGYWVRGVDLKYPEFSPTEADEFLRYDLTDPRSVDAVMRHAGPYTYFPEAFKNTEAFRIPFDEVYQFAADMGGAGYIFTGEHDADVMRNSALINLNVTYYAHHYKVGKIFYSSSACIYPAHIQEEENNPGLRESDAYPAGPDSEYGWEKLFSERLYLAYARNYGLNVRIARFHNIYGPEGTYKGGKEKAPAAICRKVFVTAGDIQIWGDGEQTRSFLYIDDCIDAVRLLMNSDHKEPINIGSEEMVSIKQLVQMAANIGKKKYWLVPMDGPVGVRGRNSNNEVIQKTLGWEPKFTLRQGLEPTYKWIASQILHDRH